MAKEEVKRLALKTEVVRELYLKSGNECAYPGCNDRIINADGVLIGELCHIEAAETGGPRFNKNMTNGDRRQFSNLMLMCHPHHKITDDVKKFPVERLKEIKAAHEAKFTDVVKLIRESIIDYAAAKQVHLPATLKKMDEVLGWKHTPEQLAETNEGVLRLAKRIHSLPENTKELLLVIVTRSKAGRTFHDGRTVPLREIADACGRSAKEVVEHVRILERYGMARGFHHDEERIDKIELLRVPVDWDFWADLKKYCKATGLTLHEFDVGLRFDKLDAI